MNLGSSCKCGADVEIEETNNEYIQKCSVNCGSEEWKIVEHRPAILICTQCGSKCLPSQQGRKLLKCSNVGCFSNALIRHTKNMFSPHVQLRPQRTVVVWRKYPKPSEWEDLSDSEWDDTSDSESSSEIEYFNYL